MTSQVDNAVHAANAAVKGGAGITVASPVLNLAVNNAEIISILIGAFGLLLAFGGFLYQRQRNNRDKEREAREKEYHDARMQLMNRQLEGVSTVNETGSRV